MGYAMHMNTPYGLCCSYEYSHMGYAVHMPLTGDVLPRFAQEMALDLIMIVRQRAGQASVLCAL
jgi:hypothetical protein